MLLYSYMKCRSTNVLGTFMRIKKRKYEKKRKSRIPVNVKCKRNSVYLLYINACSR